jgi:CMP-N-acetylneuraminic acid synthetase
MIVGLQIGKEKSVGRPGKNYMPLLGRQLNEYSLLAAHHCNSIERIFVSTDSPALKESAKKFSATVIDRPPELATPEALTEDVLTHAYDEISKDIGEEPEMVVLLFANTPAIDVSLIEKGIALLREDETLDSCFSAVKYDMFSPTRAKKIENDLLVPFVDPDYFGEVNSIRSSQGEVFFADLSIQILRPSCFLNIEDGTPPLKWMGQKCRPLRHDFGFDLDEEWQIPVLEYWLKKRGFTESGTPYE